MGHNAAVLLKVLEISRQAEGPEAEAPFPVWGAAVSLQEAKWGQGRPLGPGGQRLVRSMSNIRSAKFLLRMLGKLRLVLWRWHTDAQSMASREVLLGPMVV